MMGLKDLGRNTVVPFCKCCVSAHRRVHVCGGVRYSVASSVSYHLSEHRKHGQHTSVDLI